MVQSTVIRKGGKCWRRTPSRQDYIEQVETIPNCAVAGECLKMEESLEGTAEQSGKERIKTIEVKGKKRKEKKKMKGKLN